MIPKCQKCKEKDVTHGLHTCRCPSLCESCALGEEHSTCLKCGAASTQPVKLRRSSIVGNNCVDGKCRLCFERGVESTALYGGSSCRCLVFCKDCARRVATGGKCPKCDQLFMDVMRV